MRSVADALRERTVARTLDMSARERIELALRLGDEDVRLFATTQQLSPAEARRVLASSRHRGRGRSLCACR